MPGRRARAGVPGTAAKAGFQQFNCIVNTVLSLLGATVATFVASAAVYNKFDMARPPARRRPRPCLFFLLLFLFLFCNTCPAPAPPPRPLHVCWVIFTTWQLGQGQRIDAAPCPGQARAC